MKYLALKFILCTVKFPSSYEISGFRPSVPEAFALLTYFAV